MDNRESKEWSAWPCAILTILVITIPFLSLFFIKSSAAIIGWVLAVLLYAIIILVYGKGHVIEGAVAAILTTILIVQLVCIYMIKYSVK
jgi:hypothetical protein